MKLLVCLFLLAGLHASGQSEAEINKLRYSVVEILGKSRGSGFLSGKVNDSVYVVTAKHVVAGDYSVQVNLEGISEPLPARVVFLADGDLDDVALLSVYAPDFKFTPLKVNEVLEPNSNLFFIKSSPPKLLFPEYERASFLKANSSHYRYFIAANGITEGDSGGGVFLDRTSQLIGIVLGGDDSVVTVLQIERVHSLLKTRFNSRWQLN